MKSIFFVFLLNVLCAEMWNAQILQNNVVDPMDPSLTSFTAVNDHGVAIVRWTDGQDLKSIYSLDGGISWSSIHTFNTTPYFLSLSSFYQPLSMNAQGEALFSWTEMGGMELKGSFFSPQSGWGSAHTFSNNGFSYVNLNKAIGDNGRTVISWIEFPNGLMSSFYEPTSDTWTSLQIGSLAATLGLPPCLGMSPSGEHLFAYWMEESVGVFTLFISKYNGTMWAPPQSVDTFSSVHLLGESVQMQVNDSGTAVICYGYDAPGDQHVVKAAHYNGVTWTPSSVVDFTSAIEELQVLPQLLSLNTLGHAIVFWQQKDKITNLGPIYSSFYDGASWQPPSLIQANLELGNVGGIALDESDRGYAVFSDGNGNVFGAAASPVSQPWNVSMLDFGFTGFLVSKQDRTLISWLHVDLNMAMMTLSFQARVASYSSGQWIISDVGPTTGGPFANFFALVPVPALSSDRALISWGQLGSNLLYVSTTSIGPVPPPSGSGVRQTCSFLFQTKLTNTIRKK